MAESQGSSESGAVDNGGNQPQQFGGWQMLKTIAIQMLFFYMITSFFRSGNNTPPTGPDGAPIQPAVNIFQEGQQMELSIYLTDIEGEELVLNSAQLLWSVNLEYGNWEDGPLKDGCRSSQVTIPVPQSVQDNGSWYLHVLLVKSGKVIDTDSKEYDDNALVHEIKLFNKYKKHRIHRTANLITGESDIAPGSIKVSSDDSSLEDPPIISYWHPNVSINVVFDTNKYVKGQIPQPLDKFIEFNESGTGFFPILYINNYWNLASEYQPINETVKNITLNLMFTPLTFFRFQLYASVSRDNPWSQWMGQSDPSDEEQDTIKETLLETNPYLLGLTVAVSIVHSIFEFLAFKNDVQFWRSRKSLEGLSVRFVFFSVFQSFIVLLYILDNETNFVVIISVFVGLLIDMWKITKVTDVTLDRQDLIGGVIPKIKFIDRPSYVQSSTKDYDKLAFKYLGWALFPLFICYGIYSLVYQEHKGWYSFILSMCYGFLLTFGFITMTPQLFINYKLKSVAHLPWRMLTYKALNTFIDDMFAFVIKMPTMYRIGCFRDDIVFFIYLYQRWIYRVDPKRVNEYGTSGADDHIQDGDIDSHQQVTDVDQPVSESVKSSADKKDD